MIEINLLPDEMRQPEGTPPARLAVIILGVVFAGLIGSFVAKYQLVAIPGMRTEIKNREIEIKAKEKDKADIEVLIAKIDTINQKVETLEKLMQSRVRYSRLLDRLCQAVNEGKDGAWFRSFNVATTGSGVGGAKFLINLSGYTTGKLMTERTEKLADLLNSLDKQFRQRDCDKSGVNQFLGAKFEKPNLISWTPAKPPPFTSNDARLMKEVKTPEDAIDFVMTMDFELATNQAAAQ
ncbi:MAG TPA: hypothetical protein VGP72_04115 [Planctomycetota bacterium]|jgi:Tfp pilus assembly protein PilN